jgi:hypothetical protein
MSEPPTALDDSPEIECERLGVIMAETIRLLQRPNKDRTHLAFEAIDGAWTVTHAATVGLNGKTSAHERIERKRLSDECAEAGLTLLRRLDPECCERLALVVRILILNENPILRFSVGQTTLDLPIFDVSKNFAKAAAALSSLGLDTFLAPPIDNAWSVRIAERQKTPYFDPHDYELELKLVTGEAKYDELVANAIGVATFFKMLRHGKANPFDFTIETVSFSHGNAVGKHAKTARRLREKLIADKVVRDDA